MHGAVHVMCSEVTQEGFKRAKETVVLERGQKKTVH